MDYFKKARRKYDRQMYTNLSLKAKAKSHQDMFFAIINLMISLTAFWYSQNVYVPMPSFFLFIAYLFISAKNYKEYGRCSNLIQD